MLDDTPASPLFGPPLSFGLGAENPYGLPVPPPLIQGPSPSLALIPGLTAGDGDVLTNFFPTPFVMSAMPAVPYVSSFSLNTIDSGQPLYLVFTVDRRSVGSGAPSALAVQAGLNQAPSDIFKSGALFRNPSIYRGQLGSVPFATAASMGLSSLDVIDSLIVYDNNLVGSPSRGGPGAEPGIDAVLFSLAPGSPSLSTYNVNAGDIFFSDFSGAFGVCARAKELAVGSGGAMPGTGDNVDGGDLLCMGDLNNSGSVDVFDLSIFVSCFGAPCGDVDLDGFSNMGDANWMMRNFGCSS